MVEFEAPQDSHVIIGVWNKNYDNVYTWPGGALEAGRYRFTWDERGDDGKKVNPGEYFLRLEIGETLRFLKYTVD